MSHAAELDAPTTATVAGEAREREILLLVAAGWGVRTFLQTSVLAHLRRRAAVRVLTTEELVPRLRSELEGLSVEPLRPFDPVRGAFGRAYRRRNHHFLHLSTTATRRFNQRLHRRTLQGRPRQQLGAWWSRLDAALRASPRRLERLWERAEAAFLRDDEAAREHLDPLRQRPPALVVSCVPYLAVEAPPVLAARHLGIPTLAWINSWDNLTSKPAYYARFDHYLVWSPRMAEELRRYYPESRAAAVRSAGVPHFDWYRDRSMRLDRARFFRLCDLDPVRPLILYAAATPHLAPSEHLTIERLVSDLGQLPARGRPQLLVRLHPGDAGGRLRDWTPPSGVSLQIPGASGRGKLDGFCPTESENRTLVSSVVHADVVVNLASTITLEAALCDRPVVNVAYDLSSRRAYQPWIDAYYRRFEHYRTVTESGAVRLAGSPAELIAHVQRYLDRPELDRAPRRRLAISWCGELDGRASERVAEALLDAAGLPGSP